MVVVQLFEGLFANFELLAIFITKPLGSNAGPFADYSILGLFGTGFIFLLNFALIAHFIKLISPLS